MKYVDGYFAADLTDPGSERQDWVVPEYHKAQAQGVDRRIILADCDDRERIAEVIAWCEATFGYIFPIVSRTVAAAETIKVLRGSEYPITAEQVMRCLAAFDADATH